MAYTKDYVETTSSVQPIVGWNNTEKDIIVYDDFGGTGAPDTAVWDYDVLGGASYVEGSGYLTITGGTDDTTKITESNTPTSPYIYDNWNPSLEFGLNFVSGGVEDKDLWVIIGYIGDDEPFTAMRIHFSLTETFYYYHEFNSLLQFPDSPVSNLGEARSDGGIPEDEWRNIKIDGRINPGKLTIFIETDNTAADTGGNDYAVYPWQYLYATSLEVPTELRRGNFGLAPVLPRSTKISFWNHLSSPTVLEGGVLETFDASQTIQANSPTPSLTELFDGADLGKFENVIHKPIDQTVANPILSEITFPEVSSTASTDKWMIRTIEQTDIGLDSGFYTVEMECTINESIAEHPFTGIALHVGNPDTITGFRTTVLSSYPNRGMHTGIFLGLWWGDYAEISIINGPDARTKISDTLGDIDTSGAFTLIVKFTIDLIRIYVDDGTLDPKTPIISFDLSEYAYPSRGLFGLWHGRLEYDGETSTSYVLKDEWLVDEINLYGQLETGDPLENQGFYFDWGDDITDGWQTSPSITHAYTSEENAITSVFPLQIYVTDKYNSPTFMATSQYIGRSFWVQNQIPVANLIAPITGFVDQDTFFNGILSEDPEGGSLIYYFDPGDGSGVIVTNNPLITYVYQTANNPLLESPNNVGFTWEFWVQDDTNQDSEHIFGTIYIFDSEGIFIRIDPAFAPMGIKLSRNPGGSNTNLPETTQSLVQHTKSGGRIFSVSGEHHGSSCNFTTLSRNEVDAAMKEQAETERDLFDFLESNGKLIIWYLEGYGDIKGVLMNYTSDISSDDPLVYVYSVEVHEIDPERLTVYGL